MVCDTQLRVARHPVLVVLPSFYSPEQDCLWPQSRLLQNGGYIGSSFTAVRRVRGVRAILRRKCGCRGYGAVVVADALIVCTVVVIAPRWVLSASPYCCRGPLACSCFSVWTSL